MNHIDYDRTMNKLLNAQDEQVSKASPWPRQEPLDLAFFSISSYGFPWFLRVVQSKQSSLCAENLSLKMQQILSAFYVYKKTNKNINIIYIYFLEKESYLKENMMKIKRQIKNKVYTHVYVYTSTYYLVPHFYITLACFLITHSSRSECSFL